MKDIFKKYTSGLFAAGMTALFASCASPYPQQPHAAYNGYGPKDAKAGGARPTYRAEPVQPHQQDARPVHGHQPQSNLLNNFIGSVHYDERRGLSIGGAISGGNSRPLYAHPAPYYYRAPPRYYYAKPVVPLIVPSY